MIIFLIIATTRFFGSFPRGLTQIPEPIRYFANVPDSLIMSATNDCDYLNQGNKTDMPISSARAERSSIVGVEVLRKSSLRASSWYGSGRERRGREKDIGILPYGVVLRRGCILRGEASSVGGRLGDRRKF